MTTKSEEAEELINDVANETASYFMKILQDIHHFASKELKEEEKEGLLGQFVILERKILLVITMLNTEYKEAKKKLEKFRTLRGELHYAAAVYDSAINDYEEHKKEYKVIYQREETDDEEEDVEMYFEEAQRDYYEEPSPEETLAETKTKYEAAKQNMEDFKKQLFPAEDSSTALCPTCHKKKRG